MKHPEQGKTHNTSTKKLSKITKLRQARGLTQLELAVLVGVTPNTIQGWEKNGLPHLGKYLKLASILGCKLDELDDGSDGGLFDRAELAEKFGGPLPV
jgi:transcriptional regulator with XRE-family HTH domain